MIKIKSDRLVISITIIACIISIYQIVSLFDLFILNIKEYSSSFHLSTFIRVSVLLFILPMAIFSFWKRKPIGWVLLTVMSIYLIVINLLEFLVHLWQLSFNEWSIIALPVHIIDYLPWLLLLSIITFVLFTKKILSIYRINWKLMIITLILTLLLTLTTEYLKAKFIVDWISESASL